MAEVKDLLQEQTLVENMAEAITGLVDRGCTPDTPKDLRNALIELAMDAFEMGAQWADNTSHREGKVIIQP